MMLAAGLMLGPYEIVSPIGAGGMGGGVTRCGHATRARGCDRSAAVATLIVS
jgi:hypothetical protein